jgi:hypothetical protein
MKLDIEHRELARSLAAFQESLQSGDRLTVAHPQRAADVEAALDQAIRFWTASNHHYLFYNAIDRARDSLRTVKRHSTLLHTLPKAEEYSTLFHRVVLSIIKVSRPHPGSRGSPSLITW